MKQIKPETTPTIYCDAKQLAIDYRTAKIEVYIYFLNISIILYFSFL
jgi:hypothetical protein